MQNIANICGVSVESIQQDGSKIIVGSHELPLANVFFNEINSSTQLTDYFNAHEEDSAFAGKIIPKYDSKNILNVSGLNVSNEDVDAGVYEISGIDGKKIVVFTGSISGTSGNPDLTSFPEVLLAIAVLDKIRCADSVSWASVLEGLGPFVVYPGTPPLISLGECGLYVRRQNTFSFTWNNSIPSADRARKLEIPEEAESAYLAALQDSATGDVAILRLYRVLEILFAGIYKNEIANADLAKVIALIQFFQSTSELDTLRRLVDKSTFNFTRFTKTDFDILFSGHRPQGNYIKIAKWLDDATITTLPSHTRAHIIYYLRCALIHSKMTEKEPFLIGPFSQKQEEALKHLVEDMRDIIKDLLF